MDSTLPPHLLSLLAARYQALQQSGTPADEPPVPQPLVVSRWRTPTGVAIVLGPRSDPPVAPSDDTPPRALVVSPWPVRSTGVALAGSTRAGDEPPTPRPVVVAPQWRTPTGAVTVLASRSDPPVAPADDTPPRPLVYTPNRPREASRVVIVSPPAADDTRVPVPLVVVPPSRLATTRPIVTWTRTDPDAQPRPLVMVPSTRRAPGVALVLWSVADPPVVVAGDAPPWPALVVVPRRATSTTSALILSSHFTVEGACPPPTMRPDSGDTNAVVATLTRPSSGDTNRVTATTARVVTAATARVTGTTVRPTGTTTRPSTGTTPRTTGTTAAPDSGDNNRPDSGDTSTC